MNPIETRFTFSKARLICVKIGDSAPCNWIFLPGGPGLSAEYFLELIAQQSLPGKLWLLDLPGNGNYTPQTSTVLTMQHWKEGLKEALALLPHPILVAHSFGGMLFQSIPSSDVELKGLMLLGTAPKPFAPSMDEKRKLAHQHFLDQPSQASFKEFCKLSAAYWFTEKGLGKGIEFVEKIPVNYEPFLWASNFYSTYERQWKPKKNLPTWIVAGGEDRLAPLQRFDDEVDFNPPYIKKVTIPGGAHFPWIESPDSTKKVFNAFGSLFF